MHQNSTVFPKPLYNSNPYKTKDKRPKDAEVFRKMSLIVKAKIKETAKGMNVSSDFADALNSEVQSMVKRACQRADANGRKTVQARDL